MENLPKLIITRGDRKTSRIHRTLGMRTLYPYIKVSYKTSYVNSPKLPVNSTHYMVKLSVK